MEIINSKLLKNTNRIKISGEEVIKCSPNWRITECMYWRDFKTNKITSLTIMMEQKDAQLELD